MISKKLGITLYLLSLFLCSFSQHRSDKWMLGYGLVTGIKPAMDFSSGVADTFSLTRPMEFFITDASICDTSGQLLFYTNGQQIENRFQSPLFNSSNFNSGWGQTFYTRGLGYSQGAIILPDPGDNNRYYLLYVSNEDFFNYHIPNDTATYQDLEPFNLSYTHIDMALDSGKGGVLIGEKNINIINDTILLGRLTACRHANGRDWWLMVHKYYSDIFYKVLITPLGIATVDTQTIGPLLLPSNGMWDFDRTGQAFFSPNGQTFAMSGPSNIIDIYKFDRCTGLLDSAISINFPDTSAVVEGLSFSPNSRFLYVSHFYNLYQYDTWASNIDSSRILVTQYDSFTNPFPTYFFMHQLAPDNKIYINTWGSSLVFHVIESPDSLGLACNVQQHSLIISNYNFSIPNFPNYDLGRLIGSPCDTITIITEINSPPSLRSLKFYPNPANTRVHLQYRLFEESNLRIFDVTGRIVKSIKLKNKSGEDDMDVSELTNGTYYYQLFSQSAISETGKLLIVR